MGTEKKKKKNPNLRKSFQRQAGRYMFYLSIRVVNSNHLYEANKNGGSKLCLLFAFLFSKYTISLSKSFGEMKKRKNDACVVIQYCYKKRGGRTKYFEICFYKLYYLFGGCRFSQ